ncbi:hypothetical protein [Microcoleus sp. FACHB-68]|uniref:hypothetical protein n=1 Tax=Microcoleus sp. FACHB-68 TaxID=2692826 RepID=UPI0016870094|nr:hypothetical protein [Microcoleus sp. FACHB-68]MBD1940011.1 hypothetical protein [Microcoleus sp. FACHB-68]
MQAHSGKLCAVMGQTKLLSTTTSTAGTTAAGVTCESEPIANSSISEVSDLIKQSRWLRGLYVGCNHKGITISCPHKTF